MGSIVVPLEGRQTRETSSESLIGIEANAFFIMGRTDRLLKDAGATREYREAYGREARSGDYDHLLQASIAYLDAEPGPCREHEECDMEPCTK